MMDFLCPYLIKYLLFLVYWSMKWTLFGEDSERERLYQIPTHGWPTGCTHPQTTDIHHPMIKSPNVYFSVAAICTERWIVKELDYKPTGQFCLSDLQSPYFSPRLTTECCGCWWSLGDFRHRRSRWCQRQVQAKCQQTMGCVVWCGESKDYCYKG